MKSVKNMFGIKEGAQAAGGIALDDFLNELPQLLGYDIGFKKIDKTEPGVHFEVEGTELDSFLGPNCEMLDALAHLSMRVLRKNEGVSNAPAEEGENIFRVTFDAQGFRDSKSQELKDLAANQRQKVIDSGGKPAYIKALGPSERKIIHTTLADLGEVTSESIGRGNFKRIRVKLKDDSTFRKEGVISADGIGNTDNPGNGDFRRQGNGGGGGGQNRGARAGRNNNNRGGRGGRGGGGGGGRFGGGGGGNNGGGRGPRRDAGNYAGGNEPNGNREHVERPVDFVDDNIGNRLKPGEEPLFNYNGDGANN